MAYKLTPGILYITNSNFCGMIVIERTVLMNITENRI